MPKTAMPMQLGLILFAHGARDPRWASPFEAVLARVQALSPEVKVRLAFLELMTPSLPEAAAELVALGCGRITVQPMFLGTGGHLRRDLPLLLDELRLSHPIVDWRLEPAIGEHPQVMDAMARAAANWRDAVTRADSTDDATAIATKGDHS
jgi:sirohydrochlorin cobaltochelatase